MAKVEEIKRPSEDLRSANKQTEVAAPEAVPDRSAMEDSEERRSRRDKARSYFREHPRAKWLVAAILLVLIVGSVMVWRHYAVRETTDDAQLEGDIVPVAARVSGTVQSVNVRDNQIVEPGQVVVQLDRRDYEVALAKAQADLADSQANAQAARVNVPIAAATNFGQLDTARANVAAAEKQVDEARATLAQAQANHKKTADDLRRYEALVAKDEIPRQTYDAAVAAEQSVRAQVDSAQAAIATAQSRVAQAQALLRAASAAPEQVSATRSKAGSAEAGVKRNQANVEMAKLNLEYTTVKAAVAGIVSKKTVEPGQIVTPGQPLMSLVPLENIWVVANYKENQLKDMRMGQPVKVHVDAYGRDYDGHIDSIAGASAARFSLLPPENATGNYVKVVQRVPVKIVLEKGQDPEHLLRPGMSVVPTVLTKSRE